MSFTGQPKLWVLIADGGRARIVMPEAHHGRFHTVLELGGETHPHFPPSERQDGQHKEEHTFAVGLAHRLNQEAAAGAYEKLVLSTDLTKVPDHELKDHLAEWWMGSANLA